jgi:hypothetical protein
MGDTTKGGRDATPEELETLSGFHHNGVPNGIDRCHTRGKRRGTCLDSSPKFEGKVMKVYCTCGNDSRCAFCGELYYERKVNANYYDPEGHQIWYIPGFVALKHSCKRSRP